MLIEVTQIRKPLSYHTAVVANTTAMRGDCGCVTILPIQNNDQEDLRVEMNQELLEKAKEAKSAEELLSLAKENGVELTKDEAEEYFAQMHQSGELSDEELDNVAGGGCHKKDGRLIVTVDYGCDQWACSICGSKRIFESQVYGRMHHCSNGNSVRHPGACSTCKFMSYEGGMWLCNHPSNTK